MVKEKAANGDGKYAQKDEKFNKKRLKKVARGMKTAGLATALNKAKSSKDKSKLPKVKPSSKAGY